MAGFFNIGERKRRPGVYARIANIGKNVGVLPFAPVEVPDPSPGGEETVSVKILVSPEGVMYAVGPALSIGSSGTVVIADAVNATADGATLVIKNSRM